MVALDKVMLSQVGPTSGAIHLNRDLVAEKIENAKEKGAQIVVLPETVLTGYCVADQYLQDDFIVENKAALESLAELTKGIIAVVGFVDYDPTQTNRDGTLRKYNSVGVFCDGELIAVRHKQNLVNYRYFDDKRYFVEGAGNEIIECELNGELYKFGVVICEDSNDTNYDVKPIASLTEQGADQIFVVNASPYERGKLERRFELIANHAQKNHVPIVYLNTAGLGDNCKNLIPFDGQSFVVDQEGQLLHQSAAFKASDDLISFKALEGASLSLQKMKREQELFEAIVMSTKEYVEKVGFKKILVPVSGGIDSALGLAVAVAAVGSQNVIAYTLPTEFNSTTTVSAAETLMKNFGVTPGKIPIQSLYQEAIRLYTGYEAAIEKELTLENIQPRMRTLMMRIASQEQDALLMACGNKTELAFGYCTLEGDLSGAMAPLGDLYKMRDVYPIARYVNELFGTEMIPQSCFSTAPSAELREGQVDPFDYWIADAFVEDHIESRLSPQQLLEQFKSRSLNPQIWHADDEGRTVYDKFNSDTFEEKLRFFFKLKKQSSYKRGMDGPAIPTVTSSTFGFDYRETLINGWQGGFNTKA